MAFILDGQQKIPYVGHKPIRAAYLGNILLYSQNTPDDNRGLKTSKKHNRPPVMI
jgi:hypothetical protein